LLSENRTREVSVTRQNITAPAVESEIDGEIGILKVNRFGDDTVSLAKKYATEFIEKGVKKVIVDLRNNPGGTVNSAQGLLGLWLDRQVAMTERRGSEIVKTAHTTGSPILGNMKTVVLINGNSASASEITAGALRDYGKAKLVGQKSYGKGSVQLLIGLSGGSQMKVTEARWYTPKGNNIDKTGIEPDVKVDLSPDNVNNGRDPQMDKAKSL
jgi:carboxyl-terminal protease